MVRIFSVFSVKLVSYDDHVMWQCWVWALVTGQEQAPCCITSTDPRDTRPGHLAVNGHSLISLNFSAAEIAGEMSVTRNVRRQGAKHPRNRSFYSGCGIPAIASHDKQTDGEREGVGSVKECEGKLYDL